MIAQIKTPRQKQRFLNACRGKLCLGATMPLAFALFGKSQPGRFFAGPTLALDVGGSTAWLAGHANPEELAGFLAFCGCEAVVLDEAECPPPTGWKRAKTHSVFGLAPGRQLPLPEADAALWQSLAKNTEPAAGKAADLLFPDRPSKRDDFYSELCSKRSRGLARVWTLEREGNIICTVGAYALANGQAYMACGQTVLLCNVTLAAALSTLPEQAQEEIFRYYFLHQPQRVIGAYFGQTRSTAGRHIQLALQRLREEMEVSRHE